MFESLSSSSRHVLDFLLTSAKPDERPFLKVSVFGRELMGLLDSGASRTIIGEKAWKYLQTLNLQINKNVDSVRVANGEVIEVLGSVHLPLSVENSTVVLEVLIVPSISQSLILGVDFWKRVGIVPNLREGCWEFGTQVASVETEEKREGITAEQVQHLNELVDRHFEQMPNSLGLATCVEHEIKTSASPIKQRYYPLSPALQTIVDVEVEKMLSEGVIEPSKSPWSSPVVLVRKKDGTYRFCVDYRRVNAVTEKDAYPLPYISAILDRLRDAKVLSTLDIRSAYWQIAVKKESLTNNGIYGAGARPFSVQANAFWASWSSGYLPASHRRRHWVRFRTLRL